MKPCPECERFSVCEKICEKVEKYLKSSVEVSIKEIRCGDGDQFNNEREYFESVEFGEKRSKEDSRRLKKYIIRLFLDGKNYHEIAHHLPCSVQYIHKVVSTKFPNKALDFIDDRSYN